MANCCQKVRGNKPIDLVQRKVKRTGSAHGYGSGFCTRVKNLVLQKAVDLALQKRTITGKEVVLHEGKCLVLKGSRDRERNITGYTKPAHGNKEYFF